MTIAPGDIPDILAAIGFIFVSWMQYNQYSKNKMVDLKIDQYKSDLKNKSSKDAESAAMIYGQLWQALHDLKTDRVYIIQPHPSNVNRYLTITMEVRKKGVSSMKPNMMALPMSDVANFVSVLAKERWIRYDDISTELFDKQARAILVVAGVQSLSIHRLENSDGKWIGNLVCEHTQKVCWDCLKCEKLMAELAKTISPILPDYEG